MSKVTVVPTAFATAQIASPFSRAIFSPSAPSAWPTADNLTETSAVPVKPELESAFSTSL